MLKKVDLDYNMFIGPRIVTDGLVMYLDAGNGSGTTWYDLSGNDNNGILTNGPIFNPANNNFEFDGIDDYISISETNLTDWSISAWVKLDYDSNRNDIIDLPMSSTNNSGQIVYSLRAFTGLDAIETDPSGNVFIGTGGMGIWNESIGTWFVSKIQSTGELDTNFDAGYDSNGALTMHTIHYYDGYIYVAGTNLAAFSKINPTTGEIISSLSSGASSLSNRFTMDEVNDKVYHAGLYTSFLGQPRKYLAKFDLNTFALDMTFDTSNGPNTWPSQMFLTSDGYLYLVGGNLTTYGGVSANHIIKISATTGQIDPTFTTGVRFNDGRGIVADIDSQDRLVITGRYFTSYNGTPVQQIIRINTDGTLDTTFNVTSFTQISTTGTVFVQTDDKVIVTGYFSSYNGTTVKGIVRINTDGSIDNTFLGNNYLSTTDGRYITQITQDTNGKLIFGRSLYKDPSFTYNGVEFNTLIRLELDGEVDTTFDTSGGFTDSLRRAAMFSRIKNLSGTVVEVSDFGPYPTYGGRREPQFFRDSLNGWRMITYTKDDTNTFRVYFDGVEVDEVTYSTSTYQNFDLNIDQLITSTCDVSSISIYNRALTQSEITQNYNTIKYRFSL